MANFRVETYTNPSQRDTAISNAQSLSAVIHKLRGGDRAEPVDLDNTPLTPGQRARAQAKLLAGTLARTTGHSAVIEDEETSEIRMLIDDRVSADLATHGQTRLTARERTDVQTAVAEAVERGRPAPGGAGGAGRGNRDGSIVAGRP